MPLGPEEEPRSRAQRRDESLIGVSRSGRSTRWTLGGGGGAASLTGGTTSVGRSFCFGVRRMFQKQMVLLVAWPWGCSELRWALFLSYKGKFYGV